MSSLKNLQQQARSQASGSAYPLYRMLLIMETFAYCICLGLLFVAFLALAGCNVSSSQMRAKVDIESIPSSPAVNPTAKVETPTGS
jgi:hypothetical protein